LGASVITLFEFAYFIFRLITLACRKRKHNLERHMQQYDSTRYTDDYNESTENKKSLGDIRFTLTPAHSVEDLDGTEDLNLDEQMDTELQKASELDTRSLEEKLESIRNQNFTITV
jgi:protein subunit release factor A